MMKSILPAQGIAVPLYVGSRKIDELPDRLAILVRSDSSPAHMAFFTRIVAHTPVLF